MNTRTKRRLIVVTGIIVVVVIVALAVIGSSTAATSLTINQAADGTHTNERVQVSGNVKTNSYATDNGTLTFSLYDPDDTTALIDVSFDGSTSATFGNDINAVCTGKIGTDGVLYATELVTKCPSKYENATDALSIDELFAYGDTIIGKIVKVAGTVQEESLQAAGLGDRFVLVDESNDATMAVMYDDALSEDVKDGANLVLTGVLDNEGKFKASDVAVEQ